MKSAITIGAIHRTLDEKCVPSSGGEGVGFDSKPYWRMVIAVSSSRWAEGTVMLRAKMKRNKEKTKLEVHIWAFSSGPVTST